MDKYVKLWEYLQGNYKKEYLLSFEEVHRIIGFEIDHSFLSYKKNAKEYGYEVRKMSLKAKMISFIKLN